MRRQKRISCYLPSVSCSDDRVNPLGEHRLQGSRIATIIAPSSMERTVDLASLGPVGRSAAVSRCFHFATVFWLIQFGNDQFALVFLAGRDRLLELRTAVARRIPLQ